MSANASFSRLERAYVQAQPVFGTIPNVSGTATVGNANACRFIRMELSNAVGLLERPDKTGTRSREGVGVGRKGCTWNIDLSMVSNGTAGTPPDADPIFSSIFGQTAAVGAGTAAITSSTAAAPIVLATAAHGITTSSFEVVAVSGHLTNLNANGVWLAYAGGGTSLTLVGSDGTGSSAGSGGVVSRVKLTYSFIDTVSQFTLWSFRSPSTLDQRVAHSCITANATFSLNQDVATFTASGEGLWTLRSADFANSDAYQKGGLTAFPTEPAAPVTNGSIIPGFTGRFTAGQSVGSTTAATFSTGASTFTGVRGATITIATGNVIKRDTFGSYYGTSTEGDVRTVSATFNVYDDDSTQVTQLKAWGDSKTPIDMVMNIGTAVGSTFVFIVKNVYLASHALGDGQISFDVGFGDSVAKATTLAVKDEFSMVIA